MEYLKTVPFAGNRAKALDMARSTFAGQGFQIVANNPSELRVKGPGLNSTKENPLRGVSEATVIVRATSLEIKAQLGGLQRLKTFLRYFPLGLELFFLIVFGAVAWNVEEFRQPWIFLIPVLALAPWLFLAPMMSRSLEKKTTQAVDTLLNNMAVMARSE